MKKTNKPKRRFPDLSKIIEDRGTLKNKEIALKYGVSVSWLIKTLRENRAIKLQAGRQPINYQDQKVKAYGYVKRKHHNKVQRMIDELIKPFR